MFNHLIPDCFNLILKELDIRSLKNYGVCSKESYSRSKQVKTEYKEKYWENIKELRELYQSTSLCPLLNEHVKDSIKVNNNKQLTFKETVVLKPHSDSMYQKADCYIVPYNKNVVYRNLRYVNKNNQIVKCEYEVGGQPHTRIFKDTFKTLRFMYGIDDEKIIPFNFSYKNRYLPCVSLHDIKFYVEFEKEKDHLTIEPHPYDKCLTIEAYTIDIPFEEHITNCLCVLRNQFTGNDLIVNYITMNRLNFSHMCTHLIFKVHEGEIENMKLYINGKYSGISLKDVYIYDNYYIIPLAKSLKTMGLCMSSIDDCTMKLFTTSNNTFLQVHAINCNLLVMLNNMMCIIWDPFEFEHLKL